jgi:predicted O-methyltransferase YrrM
LSGSDEDARRGATADASRRAAGGDAARGATGADAALAAVRDVEGWLTDDQARRLWSAAARSRPAGAVVEIGSFRGRSTIVLALAAGEVVAIDPHAGGDRGPQEIAPVASRGDADHEAFRANLAAAGVADRVRHVRAFSAEAHGDVDGPLSLLYVDGAHRFGPARADLAGWGGRVAPGGAMLVHDAFSSVGVTLALLTTCAGSRAWRYAGRSGSLAEYERRAAPADARSRVLDAARQLAELPWFARNVAIKALVLAGRRRWAERIGLDPAAPWPY